MDDLSVTVNGELMVAHIEGLNDAGTDFLDAYSPDCEYKVVDSGRIIVPQDHLPQLLTAASEQGLAVFVEQQ